TVWFPIFQRHRAVEAARFLQGTTNLNYGDEKFNAAIHNLDEFIVTIWEFLHVQHPEILEIDRRDAERAYEHSCRFIVSQIQPAISDLIVFLADRLKVQLREQGARHDLVDAVFALENQDDLLLIVRRVEALGKFLD